MVIEIKEGGKKIIKKKNQQQKSGTHTVEIKKKKKTKLKTPKLSRTKKRAQASIQPVMWFSSLVAWALSPFQAKC